MDYADITLVCRECSNEFVWTAGEQEFYASKGLVNQPSRCPDCRRARKQARSLDANGQKIAHPVTCAECGKETTVPFVPRLDRPVYCSDCFDKVRATATA